MIATVYDVIQLCHAWNKCLFKSNVKANVISREIRTAEALSHFSAEWLDHYTEKPHAVFITVDGVKTDSSAEKQPITVIRESEPTANTNIHENTFQYSAMFEPLSSSHIQPILTEVSGRLLNISPLAASGTFENTLQVSRGHLFLLGNKNA